MRKPLIVFGSYLLAALAFAGAEEDRSVLDNAVSTAKIHSFTEILRNSGIPLERLRTEEVTLLIPVDVSFYDITPEQYARLFAPDNRELAVRYVESHVIAGRLSLAELQAGPHRTLNGLEVSVAAAAGGRPAVNGRPIVQEEIGYNGRAYFIQGFLFDP